MFWQELQCHARVGAIEGLSCQQTVDATIHTPYHNVQLNSTTDSILLLLVCSEKMD